MTSAVALLEAHDIRRTADGGAVLLDGVSLAVPGGSATAIVGPAGSGKSLLLRALALLDPLQGGGVRFPGDDIADSQVPAVRRQVVLVQQRPVLIEGTVRDNLTLPFHFGPPVPCSFDQAAATRLLSTVKRDASFLQRPVSDLSGGESQIVSLLRALQLEPVVLLLDEPTSSLDADTTASIEAIIQHWRAADGERALVVVTHTPAQAARLTDRTVRLQAGAIASVQEHDHDPA